MDPLTLLLLLPVAGAVLVALLPDGRPLLIRYAAITAAALTLAYAAFLTTRFSFAEAGVQFYIQHVWNSQLGTSFALGIDGLSFPLVLLTAVLVLMALLASHMVTHHIKGYYLLMLLLESATMGVFVAQDWGLFYVFWELVLIPLFFLIDRWGGKNRQTAALNFVLYTMGGSIFMLLALLVLFDATPAHAFNFTAMAEGARHIGHAEQLLIFAGLLVGFGVKMPLFPLHGWLPLAHVEAPSPVSILLSGILLKMGSYGLLRAISILPEAAQALQGTLFALGVTGLLYGGLLAWRQSDMKKMIAYSSVSHMGVVLIGISTLNLYGMTGALYQMVAHGLVAGATFMLIGLLYERTHTRDINDYGSLIKVTPRFAFLIILAFVGGVGLPGTAGFVAELHVLIGGFNAWGWAIVLLSLGVLVSATYSIRTVKHLYTGPIRLDMQQVEDLRPLEMAAAGGLILATLLLGLYPAALLHLMEASVQNFIQAFAPDSAAQLSGGIMQ
ncbi:NADH-quinone oxidoreductase subunit M [Candidatus Thiothrix sp. Deng01]|uniref:NADH-quinone oxidoreductase subunit M n=1 Tax=Candidatus Thiothrix phosphatis TaxID=3112415 RepID=A0ABU6CXM7_9GAMM|nr:NADH-quinone oxidoreductase subunit M [Candidatus Thiothrix sp. Deng01]MEB4591321.1 NADH-quinone oxidoreductase subunit M [Candidatus Thiothrix sp. Deng01]